MSDGAGRFAGKVAFVTGAARGQGRSHAIRLAEEGADVIALDLCRPIESVPYPMAEPDDLAETIAAVEKAGRRAVSIQADVRDFEQLRQRLDDAVATLDRLDIVCANAGIVSYGVTEQMSTEVWRDVIDVNLTGAWHTVKAAVPHLLATGGGSVVLTSSTAAFHGLTALGHYVSAKHGLIGLMRTLALELGPRGIRVNAVCPGTVRTPMVENDNLYRMRFPSVENPVFEELAASLSPNPLGIPYIEPVDISNAMLFLASDEARYVTAVALPVDAGALAR
jgi:(+)-trans-carveol dehydrogenase